MCGEVGGRGEGRGWCVFLARKSLCKFRILQAQKQLFCIFDAIVDHNLSPEYNAIAIILVLHA